MKPHDASGEPLHPGYFIKEEIEHRGWSQRDLAYVLGTTEQAINLLLTGKRGISPEMAKALGQGLDVDPAVFSNLQRAYDIAQAPEPEPAIARRARLQSAYPIREMIRRGWLKDDDADAMDGQLARFFEVANANDVPHIPHAARKTSYYEAVPAVQLAWLFRVRQLGKLASIGRHSKKALKDALPRLKVFLDDPEAVSKIPQLLADCGVRLVIVESLPSAKIDGACLWLDKHSPVIGLSLRFDRIDNFWFVLRHEIEHVLNEDGQAKEIIDVDLDAAGSHAASSLPAERAANEAAEAFVAGHGQVEALIAAKAPFIAERDVLALSKEQQVHPGLIVGQIQKRTERWDFLRRHLVKIRHIILPAAVVDGWGIKAKINP